MVEHATVQIGEFTVPLIGVPKEATQESCAGCGKIDHLSSLKLDDHGRPLCLRCHLYVQTQENENNPALET